MTRNEEPLELIILGYPVEKTIHSSKLIFEDSFDELKVVVVDDGYVSTCKGGVDFFTESNRQVSQSTKGNRSLSEDYDLTSQIVISRFPDKPESKTKS